MSNEVADKMKFDLNVIQKNASLRAEVDAKIMELCPEITAKERHNVITNYLEQIFVENPLGLTNLRVSLPNSSLIRQKQNIVNTSTENPIERRKNINTNNLANLIRPNQLNFDDFCEYTNAEDVVHNDIVRKFGKKAEKYLKQIKKYLRRFYETKIVNEEMWPDYIRFKDDIRTVLLARKNEKQVADKSHNERTDGISSIPHKRFREMRDCVSTTTSEGSFCTVIHTFPATREACRPKPTSKEVEQKESNCKENKTTEKPSEPLPPPSSASSHPREITAQVNLSPDLFPASDESNKHTLQQAKNQNPKDAIVESSEEVEMITASESNCNLPQIAFCNANDITTFSESFAANPSLTDPLRISASQPVTALSQMNISKMNISQESSLDGELTETNQIKNEMIEDCSLDSTQSFDPLPINYPTLAAIRKDKPFNGKYHKIKSEIIQPEINNASVTDVASNSDESNIVVTEAYIEVMRNSQKSENERFMLDENHVMTENSEISTALRNSDAMQSYQPTNLQLSHVNATAFESISDEIIASKNSTENPKLFRESRNVVDSLEVNKSVTIDLNDMVDNSIKQLMYEKFMNSFPAKDFTSVDFDQLSEGQSEEEFPVNHKNLPCSDLRQALKDSDESQAALVIVDDCEHAADSDKDSDQSQTAIVIVDDSEHAAKDSDESEITILAEDDSERATDLDKDSNELETTVFIEDEHAVHLGSNKSGSDKSDKVNEELQRNDYPRSQSSPDICQNPGDCDKSETFIGIEGSERTDFEHDSASLDKLTKVTIKEEFPTIAHINSQSSSDFGRTLEDSDIIFVPNESPKIIVIENDPETAEELLAALMGNISYSEDAFVLPPVAATNFESQSADKVPEQSRMLEDEFDEGSMREIVVPLETGCIRTRHHFDEAVTTQDAFVLPPVAATNFENQSADKVSEQSRMLEDEFDEGSMREIVVPLETGCIRTRHHFDEAVTTQDALVLPPVAATNFENQSADKVSEQSRMLEDEFDKGSMKEIVVPLETGCYRKRHHFDEAVTTQDAFVLPPVAATNFENQSADKVSEQSRMLEDEFDEGSMREIVVPLETGCIRTRHHFDEAVTTQDAFVLPPVAATNFENQSADKVSEQSRMLEDEFDKGSMKEIVVPLETGCYRKRHHFDEAVTTKEIFTKVRRLSEKEPDGPDCNIIIESEAEITDRNLSEIEARTNPSNLKGLSESNESKNSKIMESTSMSVRSTTKCSKPKSKPVSNSTKVNAMVKKKSKKLNKGTKNKENNKSLDDTIVPQVKHNFQPLKLVSRVKTKRTLKVPPKPVSKLSSIDERLQAETTLDLENLIEDPSQDNIVLSPSPSKLTTSHILAKDESFFLSIRTTTESNQTVPEEEDQLMEDDLANQEVSSQHEVDLPKFALIKQVEILNCFLWITDLNLNSFPNCRIFSVNYESSIPLVNPYGGINMKAKFLFQENNVSIEMVGEKNIKFQLVAANCDDFSIKLIKAIEAWRISLNVKIYSLCEIVVIRALCYLFRQFQRFQLIDIKQIIRYEDYVITNSIFKRFHKTVSSLSKFFDSETMSLLNL